MKDEVKLREKLSNNEQEWVKKVFFLIFMKT